ncbi:hypothetical protein ACFQY0_01975 [Haloferula chungangensis]|uniref:AsmA-like C-terminal domain-containing protein n=1 Tax=Haloferula chungangensis TaxID=1048331 RepID=A0ABW2L463_9BACT
MNIDNSQTFNDRLSQWIASQGFWFQLRYSMSSGSGWSVAVFHLVKLGARVLVLLLVVAVIFAFYLSKRIDSEGFKEKLSERFITEMSASDAEIVGFERVQGRAKIRRIGAEGTPSSFFQTLEAGNLSFKMGYLDGFSGDWDAGIIEGNWIDVQVKAGANSGEEASAAAESLFKRRRQFEVMGLDFSTARVTWGYDKRVGEIEGSKLTANRVSEGWRFNFKGGRFTQNWIHDFQIEEIAMLCTPTELIIEKGILLADDGRVELKDVKIEGGELPQVSGRLVLTSVPIEKLVPENVLERVSGKISGELELSGSTNTTEGLSLQGPITLGERDSIQIRDEFPILEALDLVDNFNSYKRVVFEQGSFNLKTGGGEMVIAGMNLEARDFMSIEGRLEARYPTDEEIAKSIGENAASMLEQMDGEEKEAQRKKDITLKRAGDAAKDDKSKENLGENTQFFAGLASKRDEETIRRAAARRARTILNFEGGIRLTIPGDAFDRSRILRDRYPVDPATGRIGIDVRLSGSMPELTLPLAEEIVEDGRSNE